ncbi:MAG: hypothetical protein ACI4JC_05335 [Faecalibacterium sp.]
MENKKLTRKRFKKLLMAHGVSRNNAQWLIGYLTELRHAIESHGTLVLFYNPERAEYCLAKAHPYAQVCKSFIEDGVLLV